MDLKLQQALVATRAGEPETAQILLAELIQERPEEANAWFMLSYLVDTSERQARYLQQVLALNPDHELAHEHLQRLRQGVPPPVIRSKQRPSAATGAQPGVTVPASATPPAPATPPPAPAATGELPEWLQDLDNKRLGAMTTAPAPANTEAAWARSAGAPKRQGTPAAAAAAPRAAVPEKTIPAPLETIEAGTVSANQKLLLGVLFALVLLSILVLGILLWQIFL